jgi:hypothetical protein
MNHTTLEYEGLSLDIEFDYQPEEPMELEYPGCDEEFTIEKIMIGEQNLYELFQNNDLIEELEELMIKQLKDNY